MKKSILTFSILLFSLTAFSQVSDSLAIQQLKQKVGQLQTEIKNQKSDFSEQIEALQARVETLSTQSQQIADSLGLKITDTRAAAGQQIANVDKSLDKTTVWAIIGILLAIIVSGALYWLLRKKQQSNKKEIIEQLNREKLELDKQLSDMKKDVLEQLSNTKKDVAEQLSRTKFSIEENLTKELGKQAELVDALIKNISSAKKKTQQPKKEKSDVKEK